jgi:MATE family multidrug resistance protein
MAQSAALGDLILAANTILLQIRYFTSYSLDGFATAAEVVVGSAVGTGNRERLLSAIRLCLGWGMAVGGALSLLYFAAHPWWPGWFTDNAAVLALVLTYGYWAMLEPWLSNIPFILDGIYVGATATRTMRNAMVISVFLVFLPSLHLLAYFFGNHGLWAAGLTLYLARAATMGWPVARLFRDPSRRLR